jgi:23S rRNA pseudouridine2605 synthase
MKNKKFRVQKLLSNFGFCSRRKAEGLIKQGRVRVNNKNISIGDKAFEDDKLFVDDKLVKKPKRVYAIFNKPIRCVTALKDDKFKTIMEYINLKNRVFPVGRLDYLTSGLLILTNDGDFANKVMHPRYEIKKTYLAGVDKQVSDEIIKEIESGVFLEDGKTSPAKVKRITDNSIEITIHEGKNRIVRRLLKKLGFRIRFVHRVRIGSLSLADLNSGEFKVVRKSVVDKVFEDYDSNNQNKKNFKNFKKELKFNNTKTKKKEYDNKKNKKNFKHKKHKNC